MKILSTLHASSILAFAIAPSALAQTTDRSGVYDLREYRQSAPGIDVWLDQVTYRFGDRVRPFIASEPGGYLTVVRVTTDGELRVLYPRRPNEQRPFRQAEFLDDRLRASGDQSFQLIESSGMGFVFAIASYNRFDFRTYAFGSQWSLGRLATARSGDPFAIVNHFVSRVLPETADYSIDYVSYEVYSDHPRRSRYANRYSTYYGVGDYFDLCVTSFGTRYSDFCRSYGVGYFGPGYYGPGYYGGETRGRPRLLPRDPSVAANPRPRGGMKPKPLTPDPVVPGVPTDPAPLEGRLPDIRRGDAARLAELRARAMKRNGGRVTSDPTVENPERSIDQPRIYRPEPREYYPQRSEPRSMPEGSVRPEIYTAPRIERRMEQQPRPEPQVRADPRPMGRVDMPRSEPRIIRDMPGRVQAPQSEKQ